MLSRKTASARITKSPSDGSGTFEAIVAGWEIDKDNERFDHKAFDGLGNGEVVPLRYQHVPDGADPAAKIGLVIAIPTDAGLKVRGQLDLANPMAVAVYERMLLPASDPNSLKEFSVGFEFDASKTYRGPKGETVIPEANLTEVSVVYRGAQRTELLSIKTSKTSKTGWVEPLWHQQATAALMAIDRSAIQGKAAETFVLQKARLITEYGDIAREVFGEMTGAEQKALAEKTRREEAEAEARAAFDAMNANYAGGPMPKITSRFAVVDTAPIQPQAPSKVIRLPVYAIEPSRWNHDRD